MYVSIVGRLCNNFILKIKRERELGNEAILYNYMYVYVRIFPNDYQQ